METEKDRKGRKRILIALLLLLLAFIIIISFALAFFSDYVTGTATATGGTLDLTTGTASITRYYTQDGVEKSDTGATITNLNPGDIIEINMSVTNAGNKSAWLREYLGITIGNNYAGTIPVTTGLAWTNAVDAFEIYPASATNSDIRLGSTTSAPGTGTGTANPITTDVSSTNTVLSLAPAAGTTILNGYGAGAETETGGVSSFTSNYKIYFKSAANNEYQGISVSVLDRVEAMQYRNNPTPNWTNVTSTEFSLSQI